MKSLRWVCKLQPKSSLCRAESQLEVFPGLAGVEGRILKGVGEEAVHQGAEGDAVFPAGGKVLDVHPLFQSRVMKNTRSRDAKQDTDVCGMEEPRGAAREEATREHQYFPIGSQRWKSRQRRLVSSAFVFAHGGKTAATSNRLGNFCFCHLCRPLHSVVLGLSGVAYVCGSESPTGLIYHWFWITGLT